MKVSSERSIRELVSACIANPSSAPPGEIAETYRELLRKTFQSPKNAQEDFNRVIILLEDFRVQLVTEVGENPYRAQRKHVLVHNLVNHVNFALNSVPIEGSGVLVHDRASSLQQKLRSERLMFYINYTLRLHESVEITNAFLHLKLSFTNQASAQEAYNLFIKRVSSLSNIFRFTFVSKDPSTELRRCFLCWVVRKNPDFIRDCIEKLAVVPRLKREFAIIRMKKLVKPTSFKHRLKKFCKEIVEIITRIQLRQFQLYRSYAFFAMLTKFSSARLSLEEIKNGRSTVFTQKISFRDEFAFKTKNVPLTGRFLVEVILMVCMNKMRNTLKKLQKGVSITNLLHLMKVSGIIRSKLTVNSNLMVKLVLREKQEIAILLQKQISKKCSSVLQKLKIVIKFPRLLETVDKVEIRHALNNLRRNRRIYLILIPIVILERLLYAIKSKKSRALTLLRTQFNPSFKGAAFLCGFFSKGMATRGHEFFSRLNECYQSELSREATKKRILILFIDSHRLKLNDAFQKTKSAVQKFIVARRESTQRVVKYLRNPLNAALKILRRFANVEKIISQEQIKAGSDLRLIVCLTQLFGRKVYTVFSGLKRSLSSPPKWYVIISTLLKAASTSKLQTVFSFLRNHRFRREEKSRMSSLLVHSTKRLLLKVFTQLRKSNLENRRIFKILTDYLHKRERDCLCVLRLFNKRSEIVLRRKLFFVQLVFQRLQQKLKRMFLILQQIKGRKSQRMAVSERVKFIMSKLNERRLNLLRITFSVLLKKKELSFQRLQLINNLRTLEDSTKFQAFKNIKDYFVYKQIELLKKKSREFKKNFDPSSFLLDTVARVFAKNLKGDFLYFVGKLCGKKYIPMRKVRRIFRERLNKFAFAKLKSFNRSSGAYSKSAFNEKNIYSGQLIDNGDLLSTVEKGKPISLEESLFRSALVNSGQLEALTKVIESMENKVNNLMQQKTTVEEDIVKNRERKHEISEKKLLLEQQSKKQLETSIKLDQLQNHLNDLTDKIAKDEQDIANLTQNENELIARREQLVRENNQIAEDLSKTQNSIPELINRKSVIQSQRKSLLEENSILAQRLLQLQEESSQLEKLAADPSVPLRRRSSIGENLGTYQSKRLIINNVLQNNENEASEKQEEMEKTESLLNQNQTEQNKIRLRLDENQQAIQKLTGDIEKTANNRMQLQAQMKQNQDASASLQSEVQDLIDDQKSNSKDLSALEALIKQKERLNAEEESLLKQADAIDQEIVSINSNKLSISQKISTRDQSTSSTQIEQFLRQFLIQLELMRIRQNPSQVTEPPKSGKIIQFIPKKIEENSLFNGDLRDSGTTFFKSTSRLTAETYSNVGESLALKSGFSHSNIKKPGFSALSEVSVQTDMPLHVVNIQNLFKRFTSARSVVCRNFFLINSKSSSNEIPSTSNFVINNTNKKIYTKASRIKTRAVTPPPLIPDWKIKPSNVRNSSVERYTIAGSKELVRQSKSPAPIEVKSIDKKSIIRSDNLVIARVSSRALQPSLTEIQNAALRKEKAEISFLNFMDEILKRKVANRFHHFILISHLLNTKLYLNCLYKWKTVNQEYKAQRRIRRFVRILKGFNFLVAFIKIFKRNKVFIPLKTTFLLNKKLKEYRTVSSLIRNYTKFHKVCLQNKFDFWSKLRENNKWFQLIVRNILTRTSPEPQIALWRLKRFLPIQNTVPSSMVTSLNVFNDKLQQIQFNFLSNAMWNLQRSIQQKDNRSVRFSASDFSRKPDIKVALNGARLVVILLKRTLNIFLNKLKTFAAFSKFQSSQSISAASKYASAAQEQTAEEPPTSQQAIDNEALMLILGENNMCRDLLDNSEQQLTETKRKIKDLETDLELIRRHLIYSYLTKIEMLCKAHRKGVMREVLNMF